MVYSRTLWPIRLLLAFSFSVLAVYPALAQKRVALSVGIDVYDNIERLKTAVSDAEAVGKAFDQLGFDATVEKNLPRLGFSRAWQRFLNKLEPGDTAALFFAGHGVEIDGLNYLLPRDVPKAMPGEDKVLIDASVRFNELMDNLRERRVRVALFIIDACRENPFPRAGTRSVGSARGLRRVDPPLGTFVMYSAAAGEQALDRLPGADTNPNSVYTRTLLPILTTPGLSLQDIAIRLRQKVLEATRAAGHKQRPAHYDELDGPLVLKAAPPVKPAPLPLPPAPQASEKPTPAPAQKKEADKAPQPPEGPASAKKKLADATPPTVAAPSGACDDAAWREAEAADTVEAFDKYLKTQGITCHAVGRLALRDLTAWSAIDSGAAGGKKRYGSPKAPASRETIQRYLDEFGPPARRRTQALAMLAELEREARRAACQVYVKEALRLAEANQSEGCGFEGEAWDRLATIHDSLCQQDGPDASTAKTKLRDADLGRCRRARTDEKDWSKVRAVLDRKGSKAGADTYDDDRASADGKTLVKALLDYTAKQPDGKYHKEAAASLAATEQKLLRADCQRFSGDILSLAQQNQQDPACNLSGAAWSLDRQRHLDWCLKAPEAERKKLLGASRASIEQCTAPRRDDKAWNGAKTAGTIEGVSRYLYAWLSGRHAPEALQLLEQLCGKRWPEAKNSSDWEKLSLFAKGDCSGTKFGDDALRLRTALDERLWKKAKQLTKKKGYEDYLAATRGGCGPSHLLICIGDSGSGGACSSQAQDHIADFDTWASASTCDDVARYLQDFPAGRFIADAKTKLGKLMARAKSGRSDIDGEAGWAWRCTDHAHLLLKVPSPPQELVEPAFCGVHTKGNRFRL